MSISSEHSGRVGPDEAAATAGNCGIGKEASPLDPEIARLCDAGRVEECQPEDYDILARDFAEVAAPAGEVTAQARATQ